MALYEIAQHCVGFWPQLDVGSRAHQSAPVEVEREVLEYPGAAVASDCRHEG